MASESNQGKLSDIVLKLDKDRKNNPETCDVSLKCLGRIFPVHKMILAKSSDFFQKMFCTEMREKYEDVIAINAMRANILEQILDYMYTGKIDLNDFDIYDLLHAACYFFMEDLKTELCDHLLESLSQENVIKVWNTANELDLPKLKTSSEKYIKKNFAELSDVVDIGTMDLNTFQQFISFRQTSEGEETAFMFALEWVKQNLDERKEIFPQIFRSFQLSKFRKEFLVHFVAYDELVGSFPDLMRNIFLQAIRNLTNSKYENCVIAVNKTSGIFKTINLDSRLEEKILKQDKQKYGASFATHKNYLYMVGGYVDEKKNLDNVVLRLDLRFPYKGWEKMQPLHVKTWDAGVVVENDKLYVFGGYAEPDKRKSYVAPFIFDLNTPFQRWKQLKRFQKCCYDVVTCDGYFYLYTRNDVSLEKYDVSDETSTLLPKLPQGTKKLLAIENQMYIIIKDVSELTLGKYDPEGGRIDAVTNTSDNILEFHDACVCQGKIVISLTSKNKVSHIYTYDTEKDIWQLIVSSGRTSDYWKLIPFHSDPFQ